MYSWGKSYQKANEQFQKTVLKKQKKTRVISPAYKLQVLNRKSTHALVFRKYKLLRAYT